MARKNIFSLDSETYLPLNKLLFPKCVNSLYTDFSSNHVKPKLLKGNNSIYLNFSASQESHEGRRSSQRRRKETIAEDFIPTEHLLLDGDKSPGTLITIHWKNTNCYTPTFWEVVLNIYML